MGEAPRVNAVIAGYSPHVSCFSCDVLGNWLFLGRKREQNEQKWRLVNTLDRAVLGKRFVCVWRGGICRVKVRLVFARFAPFRLRWGCLRETRVIPDKPQ